MERLSGVLRYWFNNKKANHHCVETLSKEGFRVIKLRSLRLSHQFRHLLSTFHSHKLLFQMYFSESSGEIWGQGKNISNFAPEWPLRNIFTQFRNEILLCCAYFFLLFNLFIRSAFSINSYLLINIRLNLFLCNLSNCSLGKDQNCKVKKVLGRY